MPPEASTSLRVETLSYRFASHSPCSGRNQWLRRGVESHTAGWKMLCATLMQS